MLVLELAFVKSAGWWGACELSNVGIANHSQGGNRGKIGMVRLTRCVRGGVVGGLLVRVGVLMMELGV